MTINRTNEKKLPELSLNWIDHVAPFLKVQSADAALERLTEKNWTTFSRSDGSRRVGEMKYVRGQMRNPAKNNFLLIA